MGLLSQGALAQNVSGPKIWLQANQPLPVQHVPAPNQGGAVSNLAGLAGSQPVSIAAADLDGDGFQDLVVGYSTGSGGFISVHRGNIDAFAPQSDESFQAIAAGAFPSPFLLEANTFNVPISPDFIAVGNFLGNGNDDLAIAAKGGSVLYIYPGDGKGNFGSAQTFNLGGGITALAGGNFGNGFQPVLVAGIGAQGKSQLLVLTGSAAGLTPLGSFAVAGSISNILFGNFGDGAPDVAFLAGNQIQILRSSTMKVSPVSLPGSVSSFALGSFVYDRNRGSQIALLTSGGSVQIAVRNEFDPRVYTSDEMSAIRRANLNRQPPPAFVTPPSYPVNGWKIVESFPSLSSVRPGQAPVFFRTRASSSGADDVMWLSAASGQMVLISHPDVEPGAQTFVPGQVSVKPYTGTPLVALPLRINVDGRPGVMALHQGEIAPSMIMPIPDPTFTVNTTADLVSADPNACLNNVAGQCSVREAVIEANATAGTDTIMVPNGTYTLTIARNAADHHTSRTGTLEVQDSVNIVGGGTATTIIQGGTVGVSPGPPNGVDKVFSFNQDIDSFTNATVSVSNLTIQNGFNRGNTSIQDGWGGAFDFDTGTSGNNTLTITDVTLTNNTLTDGEGGGFAIFNTNAGTGSFIASNCTVSNNILTPTATNNVANGGGGFVGIPGSMTMTSCTVSGNKANSGGGINPVGGGLEILGQLGSPQTSIHASTISGNSAGGLGGGIFDTTTTLIDQGSVISNNTAGTGGVLSNLLGGGIWFNASNASTIQKVAFTGNSVSGTGASGGAIFVNGSAGGALTISFSRFAGNTAPNGSNLALASGGTGVTAQNNWWGTNATASTLEDGSGANPTSHCTPAAGQICFDPFIVLTHNGNAQEIKLNANSKLTGDMSLDNHGNGAALSGNLNEIVGLPITFDGAVLGSIPQAQPETLGNPVPTAIATFNAGNTAGFGTVNATVDQAVVAVNSNLIASATESGTTATITTVGVHGYSAGEFVRISGVGVAGYNSSPSTQEFAILSTPSTTTFTYTANSAGLGPSGGGTSNAGIVILEPPSITKSFSPTTIQTTAGTGTNPKVSTITFSVTNANVVPIDASFTDSLPTSLVVASTPAVVNNCGGTVTATAGAGTISFSNSALPEETCTIQVNVQSGVDNNYSNSVTIDSTVAGNGNTSTANLTVINPPTSAKAFGAATIPLNGTTSQTITISSTNQNQPLTAIAFTDTLPAGLVIATPSGLTTTCSGTATATAGSSAVSLSGATLAAGTSCTVSVNVQGTTAGVKNNSVTVSDTVAGTGNTSTASVTVVAPPTINKAFGATSIPLNGSTSLSFTISNPNTTVGLTGIAFSDTLPAGLIISTPNGLTGSCGGGTITATAGTGTISLSGGTIAANASCTFSINVTGTAAGQQTNTTGAVTSTEGGTGNTASATLAVVAPPSIAKAFNPTTIPFNGTTSLTFTITNPAANTVALTGVAFTDTLPTGLTVASGTSTVCGGTLTTTAPTGITLTGATIAVAGQCQFSVTVTGAVSGQYTNTTGAVSSTNGGTGNTASANLTVASPPTIVKAFGAATIPLNGTTSLTFTINNPNSGLALTGVAFTDPLPSGLVVATPSGLTNTCNGTATATAGSGTVSLSGGTIAASGSCTVSVNVQGTTAGLKTNSVTVTSTEGGTGNTSNASITVVAPPTIVKAFGAASIPLNGTTSLSFTISNPNTTVALSGIAFSDTLPAGLVISTPNSLTGSCGGGTITATAGTNSVSLSGATLAASASCVFSVDVTGTTAGSFTNTTSAVTSTNGGTGNTASANLTVVAPPSIAKVFNPSSIALNATTALTFTISNPAANTVALTGVAFTDTLPTGLTVTSGTGAACGGTLTTTAPQGISLVGATIATNSNCQFSVTVTGAVSGQFTNVTGAVSSTNGGTGNSASANLTVASPPSIVKAFNPTTIPLNATSTLTFNIANPNSGVALTGIAFTDNFPSGVVVAATPSASNTCGGTFAPVAGATSVSLSGGTLAASATCTMSVSVQGTTAGTKNNVTGAITSNEGGTGAPSNAATLIVTQASTSTAVASSVNPSVFGQAVTFTATVTNTSAGSTGAPTGSVQFVVDGVNFGTPVALTPASSTSSTATSQAIATLSVAGSPHTVTANYANADGNFINSSGSLTPGQTVTPAITNTAVTSSANPSAFGQPVTFTATVTDISAGSIAQPTGSVQFVVDGVNFGTPVTLTGASSNTSTATSQATATLSISGSPHSVTANYVNGDGNFVSSSGSLAGGQVVTKANTTTTVISSAGTITLGDTVTFTATVTVNAPATGTPTGLVTFFDGNTPIAAGVLNGAGVATFSTALLAVGSQSITAIYQGDANFSASPLSSPVTETVNLRGSTTAVSLNPTTVGAGQPSTITTTVTDGGGSTPPGAPDSFSPTGAPATARTGFTSTLFADGQVLVAGGTGSDATTVLNSAEIYSVSGGAFSSTGNLNTARTGAVAVLLPNGKVLVAGGSSTVDASGALNSAELFDPIAGTFSATSQNMTAARFGATATLLNTGKVLIAGGQNSSVLNTAELYDPAADTFTATGNLTTARTGASATLLGNGQVLVAGGSSNGTAGGALNSGELFDPTGNSNAGTFTAITGTTLSDMRWQPAAALLLSGKVLIAGGQNSGGLLTSADLYDPVANAFNATAHQMNEARANGSAVAMPNGMVLLPGGTTAITVDLYDADGDRFDTTGDLLHSDNGLVATQLNNGRVLVVGINTDNAPTLVSDAELYSPTFNPLGTVGFGSSDVTDVFGPPCALSTTSTCTTTVTPIEVGTSPHTITGTYPADAVHSGSSNTASLTVIPAAPPTIAKAFSAANVAQNSTVNVSFTIVNPSTTGSLTGISFTDALPAGLVVANPNNLNSNCGGTFTAVPGSSSLSLTGGTVGPQPPPPVIPGRRTSPHSTISPSSPASGECVITVDLLVTGTGTISNTTGPISANESGPGNPSNTATIQVVLAPTAIKAFGAVTIPVGGTTSLTFNIANPNTTATLDGIALGDTLPSGLVVASPNGLAGSCTTLNPAPVISATPGSSSINLSALNLSSAGSCSFSVNVTGTSGGTKNNTTGQITGTFDDGTGTFRVITGGTASAPITVVAPPSISKAFEPSVIVPGGVSILTFTITNPAVNTTSENGVAFTDTLPTTPANLVVATPNGATGNCNGGTLTAVAGSNSISLTGGTIPPASSCVVSVNVTTSVSGSYTNTTGAVSSTNGGTGNTATATLTVANASLSITKTHVGNFPRNSTGNNYTITVSNAATAGPTAGTVTVTDTLPNVQNTLVPTAMSGTGWTCNLATLTCTRNDALAPGASYPAITLTVTVPQNIQANVTNTATVSGGGDPNSHTAMDPTHIGPPILITSMDTGAATIAHGGAAQFLFQVDASGVSPLPTVVSFSCSGLPAGTSCIFTNPPPNGSPAFAQAFTVTQPTSQLVLTITTLGPPNTAGSRGMHRVLPTYAALLFPVMGLIAAGFAGGKRKKLRVRLAMILMGLLVMAALAGCGGSPFTTPPGQSTITVTGTAQTLQGPITGSTTISLTVQ